MKVIEKIYNGIAAFTDWIKTGSKWLIVIIIAIVFYDVFMRYVLNKPTAWAWSLTYMIGACLYAMGFAYNWLHDGNTRVDILYQRFSPKVKLWIDLVFSFLFAIPIIAIVTWLLGMDTVFAFKIHQVDDQSYWKPITWPYKAGVTVGFVFLFIQIIATFLKDVMALIAGGRKP
ncbi:MAG: TRAP transporter small permease subunit [Dehalococcoidales bacterium]|nr:TRAP transporter small permease subunit [Dehalococcoidales bacterium]